MKKSVNKSVNNSVKKSVKQPVPLLLASALAAAVTLTAFSAHAQQAPKPEQLIKWRQSAFQVLAWQNGRIKALSEGAYNKDEAVKAANAIAALANTNLATLFPAGTDSGKGWHDTTVKAALWTDTAKAGEHWTSFAKEANELARVAANGDQAALKEQFGKLGKSCKSCHDDFRNTN